MGWLWLARLLKYYVAQAAAAGACVRYGAGGRLGRRGCSRSLNMFCMLYTAYTLCESVLLINS